MSNRAQLHAITTGLALAGVFASGDDVSEIAGKRVADQDRVVARKGVWDVTAGLCHCAILLLKG